MSYHLWYLRYGQCFCLRNRADTEADTWAMPLINSPDIRSDLLKCICEEISKDNSLLNNKGTIKARVLKTPGYHIQFTCYCTQSVDIIAWRKLDVFLTVIVVNLASCLTLVTHLYDQYTCTVYIVNTPCSHRCQLVGLPFISISFQNKVSWVQASVHPRYFSVILIDCLKARPRRY